METLSAIKPLINWLPNANSPLLIAGPCSAETEEQVLETAKQLAEFTTAQIFRAGVWKPRTRPNSFEGMGEEALKWIVKAGKQTGMLTMVEIANAHHAEKALEAGIDILWIGARTTVNPFYVQEIADALIGTNIPVMVKNPVNPDLQLWLGAFERLHKVGINKLVAIHRGFSSSTETVYRNNPDWAIPIELMRIAPKLPIICDPSHIGGKRDLLHQISQKALDLGMNGLMIETHPNPDQALSDAQQQITPCRLKELMDGLVLRKKASNDSEFNNKLVEMRAEIDAIDRMIMETIARRMKVIEEIGKYKKLNSITILQLERWTQILQNTRNYADIIGLDREFIISVYNQIHLESIKLQTEVMNE